MAEYRTIDPREVVVRPAASLNEPGFVGVVCAERPDGLLHVQTSGVIHNLQRAVFHRGGVPRAACPFCECLTSARTSEEARIALEEHVEGAHKLPT